MQLFCPGSLMQSSQQPANDKERHKKTDDISLSRQQSIPVLLSRDDAEYEMR